MASACVILALAFLVFSPASAVDFYRAGRRSLAQVSSASQNISSAEAAALKPAFHITGEVGWINDPGGLFEYMGVLHVFPQYNNRSNNWAAPYWAHVASSDMVHFQRLPNACANDSSYDSGGCWTGSCFTDEDGVPTCWYTAASGMSTLGYYKQNVASLKAVNTSDPLLAQWTKPAANPLPISPPQGVSWSQFRDPHGPIAVGGEYYTFLGGADDCAGAQLLYSTSSLKNASFEFQGVLSDQYSIGQVSGTCPLAVNKTADGFQCEQFGASCRVWECTDLFTLNSSGVTALKWSDQDDYRKDFARDWYVLSDVTPDFEDAPLSAYNQSDISDALYQNELNNQQTTPRWLEFGDIYASKSWQSADGRRLILGWAFETAAGCTQQCSSGTWFTDALGYQGSHYLIREVTYNPYTQTLMQYPIEEYALLKNGTLYDGRVMLNSSSSMALVTSTDVLQSDLQVEFNITSSSTSKQTFRVGAMITFNAPSFVSAYINGTISGSNVTEAWVWIDRTNMTNTMTNATAAGQQIPLPAYGMPADDIELRFVVDHSHLEVYAFEGLALGTIKVYPNNTAAGNWTMSLFSNSSSSLNVMANAELDHWTSCWVEDAMAETPTLVSASSLLLDFAIQYKG